MQYTTILFEVKNRVARITLNRPEAANALNLEMGTDLMHAAVQCSEDPNIGAVIITGAGRIGPPVRRAGRNLVPVSRRRS